MPWDKDGAKRNIFIITIENEKGKYSTEFGSSLKDSCKETPILYSSEEVELYLGYTHTNTSTDETAARFSIKFKATYPQLLALKRAENVQNYISIVSPELLQKVYSEYTDQIEKWNTKAKRNKAKYHVFVPIGLDRIRHGLIERISKEISKAEKETTLLGQADTIKHPNAYDFLAGITKYDPGTFENFCSDFGYDEDSRSAMRTYQAVKKEWAHIGKMFTEQELEQLQEIQ